MSRSEHSRPENVRSESGYGSHAGPSQAGDGPGYQQELSSPMGPPTMSRHASHQGDFLFGFDDGHFDPLAGVGEGPVADQFAGNRDPRPRFHRPGFKTSDNGLSILHDAAQQQLASPVDSTVDSLLGSRRPPPDVLGSHGNYNGQAFTFGQTQIYGSPIKRQKTGGNTNTQVDIKSGNADGTHICKECGKRKKRECDLRYASLEC